MPTFLRWQQRFGRAHVRPGPMILWEDLRVVTPRSRPPDLSLSRARSTFSLATKVQTRGAAAGFRWFLIIFPTDRRKFRPPRP